MTLLISLFILHSCKNPDTIGLAVDSSKQLNGSFIDTSTIVVNTDTVGPVIASGLTKTPLGYFKDPALGTSEANIAVQLNLPGSTAYTLPTGTIVVDSAVLALKYADGFYGDSVTTRYKINVYQLKQRLSNATTYYSTMNWDSLADKTNLLGTHTFLAHTHDSVKVYNVVSGHPDSLVSVPAQVRIPISRNFINQILFNAGSTQLASNNAFQSNVKGLYLTLDKDGTNGPGGIFQFKLDDSLKIYYRTINGTTIDTTSVSLPLGNHAAQIRRTPSDAVTAELANQGSSRNVIYLQGLAGLKARISFPYLKNILKTIGSNIVINKAELVITPVPGSTIPYKPQPKLTMYRYDIAHQPAELQDATASDPRYQGVGTFGGFYDGAKKNYHFVITGYIQDLMEGKTVDYGTYIAPVDTVNKTSVDFRPTPETAGRTVAVGTDPNSPYRIRLNIIYTKLKD
ncbi:MAG: DUF4270 domain-containing protein [Bacteroidetes bacterium]|nr:DUF4270 domain-containing protein [Bacteroidota bacterium]